MNPLPTAPENLTGHIIMASPALKGSVFEQACILITKHSKTKGAEGFILNHCSDTQLDEAMPDSGELGHIPVHFGGPVDTKSISFLIMTASKKSGFRYRENASISEAERAELASNAEVLACVGLSAWRPGQLEEEFQHFTWFHRKPPLNLLAQNFDLDLWHHLMSSLSPYHQLIAETPDNVMKN